MSEEISGNSLFNKMKLQVTLFFYAISYFTRLPIPSCIVFDNEQFHKANAYFPAVGLLNALVMIAFFCFCQLFFPMSVSIILMLVSGLLLTGSLHEDGFADCCDGFGGGYDVTQRLKIMKDSQIGTYGGIGLIVIFLLKFNLLVELANGGTENLAIGLVLAHVLSRYSALYLMQKLPYVRLETGGGKVQSLSTKLNRCYFLSTSSLTFCCLFFLTFTSALVIITAVAMITFVIKTLLLKNLGGYTGDCLGATQQLVELSILLLCSALFIV